VIVTTRLLLLVPAFAAAWLAGASSVGPTGPALAIAFALAFVAGLGSAWSP
jgi:hypothetical protein